MGRGTGQPGQGMAEFVQHVHFWKLPVLDFFTHGQNMVYSNMINNLGPKATNNALHSSLSACGLSV